MYLEMTIKDGRLIIRLLQSDDQGDVILSEASVSIADLAPKE